MKQITLDFETYEDELSEKYIDGADDGQRISSKMLIDYYHNEDISFDKYKLNEHKEFNNVLQLLQLLKKYERGMIDYEN